MSRGTKTVLAAAVAAIFAAALAYAFLGGSRPAPNLPVPNGYDDFLAAGELVGHPALTLGTNTDLAALAKDVAAGRRALDLVRSGLSKKCRVHENPGPIGTNFVQALSGFKRIAVLLEEEARVAGATNAARAVSICLENFRFAREISRGGPLINHLVTYACQAIALQEAGQHVAGMTPAERAEAAKGFLQAESDAATWSEVVDGEQEFFDRRAGVREKIIFLLAPKWREVSLKNAKSRRDAAAARLRAFIATLENGAREEAPRDRPKAGDAGH